MREPMPGEIDAHYAAEHKKAKSLNLYLVQDSDMPMYVLASSWDEAVTIWQRRVNEFCGEGDDQPSGVQLMTDGCIELDYSAVVRAS
jgi:hypothetical protein